MSTMGPRVRSKSFGDALMHQDPRQRQSSSRSRLETLRMASRSNAAVSAAVETKADSSCAVFSGRFTAVVEQDRRCGIPGSQRPCQRTFGFLGKPGRQSNAPTTVLRAQPRKKSQRSPMSLEEKRVDRGAERRGAPHTGTAVQCVSSLCAVSSFSRPVVCVKKKKKNR